MRQPARLRGNMDSLTSKLWTPKKPAILSRRHLFTGLAATAAFAALPKDPAKATSMLLTGAGGAAAPVLPTLSWNTGVSGITYTNSNRTAEYTSGSSEADVFLNTALPASGKVFFGLDMSTTFPGVYRMGVVNPSYVVGSTPGSNANGVCWVAVGVIQFNGTNQSTDFGVNWSHAPQPDQTLWAFDMNAGKAYSYDTNRPGWWNGDDPTTNTGGWPFATGPSGSPLQFIMAANNVGDTAAIRTSGWSSPASTAVTALLGAGFTLLGN